MRAIVAERPGGPEVLELKERPLPLPGPGQVRARVAYSNLNPLDTHARAQRVAWNAPTFPFTPGYEWCGVVDQVGDSVSKDLIGCRIAAVGEWGGNADYAVATAARVTKIPDAFDWQLGACFQTGAYSAWHLIHTVGRVVRGDHVLLHAAAGSVSSFAAQIARDAGAFVYGLCSPSKMDFARSFGYTQVIDRGGDWVARLREETGGHGADLIIDGVGGPEAPRNYEAIAPLGQVIYIGATGGPLPPIDVSRQLFAKTIAVRGFVVYTAMAKTQGSEKPLIHDALATGRWRAPIAGVVDLAEVPELHARFERRELAGKWLIRVGGDL